ncbi:MAG TPA: Clp protease N-terminal domain-containing protein [Candidatus Rubrimentiphilum sp.]|nr:Clp protease N-terminal domain-containing protein [Candidatus Rubrimentiphilum sp.]
MFAKFSPASGRVLRAAEQECRNHNHYYIGVDHLLLALVQESYDSIAAHLVQDGIDPTEVHTEVRRALGTGEDRSWEGILVTPRVRAIVGIAAERSGDAPIEPVHLLEAIVEEGNSRAAEILHRVKERNKVPAAE